MRSIVLEYDAELQSNNDLQGELHYLILDCCDIKKALLVYKGLTCEEYFGNTLLFSRYYGTITDALVFEIVISLSRVFDSHKDAMSLLKTLNRIKQNTVFKNDVAIKNAIQELINIDNESKTNFDFKGPRDQCFAHLDKKQVFSRVRIIKCIGNVDDLILMVENIIAKLIGLYELCYKESPIIYETNIEIPDIRQLKDFEERAKRIISSDDLHRNHLELTDIGLKYYPLGIKK